MGIVNRGFLPPIYEDPAILLSSLFSNFAQIVEANSTVSASLIQQD